MKKIICPQKEKEESMEEIRMPAERQPRYIFVSGRLYESEERKGKIYVYY